MAIHKKFKFYSKMLYFIINLCYYINIAVLTIVFDFKIN